MFVTHFLNIFATPWDLSPGTAPFPVIGAVGALLGKAVLLGDADHMHQINHWKNYHFSKSLLECRTSEAAFPFDLLAATAQVMADALGKSLSFSATLAIEDDTGSLDIEDLRGVGRRLPAAGAGLVIGP